MNNYPEYALAFLSKFVAENPSGRMGSEEEVSAAIIYLLSPAASYTNGTCIRVDGASSLKRGHIMDEWIYSTKLPVYEALPEDLKPKVGEIFQGITKDYPKKRLSKL